MKRNKIKMLVITAMVTAVVSIISPLAIPLPFGVPVTLQTFAVAFAGYFLGYKLGVLSIFIYVLIGAVGLPVFSGFNGGLGVLTSYTGGFILGFLFLALFCGIRFKTENTYLFIVSGVVGLLLCHSMGITQFSLVSKNTFMESMVMSSIPFLIKDIASVVAAYMVAGTLRKRKIFEEQF